MSGRVDLQVDRTDDHLLVRWATARSEGSARFDRIPGSVPEWLASAEDLFEGATRRDESAVTDALSEWGSDSDLILGLWHDGQEVEIL